MNIVRLKHRITSSELYQDASHAIRRNYGKILGTFGAIIFLVLSILSLAWWDYYQSMPHGVEYFDSLKTVLTGIGVVFGMLGVPGSIISIIAIWVSD